VVRAAALCFDCWHGMRYCQCSGAMISPQQARPPGQN
jgi:hypothetical protein